VPDPAVYQWAWGYRIDRYGRTDTSFFGSFPLWMCECVVVTSEPYKRVKIRNSFAETVMLEGLRKWRDLPYLGHSKDHPIVDPVSAAHEGGVNGSHHRHESEWESFYLDYRDGQRDADSGYAWCTYGNVERCALSLSHALRHRVKISPRGGVGICGRNSIEWVIADLAALFGGFISVPLYAGQSHDTYLYIIRQVQIAAIICDRTHYDIFSQILSPSDNVTLVLYGSTESPQSGYSMLQLVREYISKSDGNDWVALEKSDVVTLMYTSGSTGRPKGAIMTDDRWNRFLGESYRVTYPYRILTVSQLPHIMERQNVLCSASSSLSHSTSSLPPVSCT
jgi:long-subunit acyl-CoA synthetase (AMP-forming)